MGKTVFSKKDEEIIARLSGDIPEGKEPFKVLAEELNLPEESLLRKINEWKQKGIIRRFGTILNHRAVGYEENAMVVWRVPAERSREVGKIMVYFPEVSHCYERAAQPGWNYNLYTMVHGRMRDECKKIAKNISKEVGIRDYRLLYSTRQFKKTSMKYF